MYEAHPAAEIFPDMDSASFAEFKQDIKTNGQREWIVLVKGKILDGRNRYRACSELGIEPEFCELEECPDPVAYVVSHNLHRRHLTTSQKAMVARELKKLLEPEAKERKRNGQKSGGRGRRKNSAAKLPDSLSGDSRDRAADMVGISGKLVDAADKVVEQGTKELQEAVKSGAVTVSKASKIADLPKREQSQALADAKTNRRKEKPESERAEAAIKRFDEKIVVARALFNQCLPGIRKTIYRLWGEWLEGVDE